MLNYKIHANAPSGLTFQYFVCLYFSLVVLPGKLYSTVPRRFVVPSPFFIVGPLKFIVVNTYNNSMPEVCSGNYFYYLHI